MEERGIGVTRQDMNERGWAKTERRPATRTVEGKRVERLGPGEDGDGRAGRQRAGLQIRQEARVFLGLLGDPVDRRALARLGLAERGAARACARRLGVDRIAVG